MNVKEAAARAGVSVRALRYYEEVGLVSPQRSPENGYREYEQSDVARVRLIHAYRELQFSLEEIGQLLDAPRIERDRMLEEKIADMERKRQRIDNRIALAHSIRMIGPEQLPGIDFSQLDDQMAQSRRYLEENPEMQALSDKFKQISEQKGEAIAEEIIQRFAEIANAPETEIEPAIQNLKACVEKYFYPCTDTILTAYARAYGGDGILAQAVEDAAGKGAAQRVRTKLNDYLSRPK